MTVFVQLKSGVAISYSHVASIEHVRFEYAVRLRFDGAAAVRLNDYDIEDMKVDAK